MAERARKFCAHAGCSTLGSGKYCKAHAPLHEEAERQKRKDDDKRRGNANARGYTYRWSKYSKWFLRQPSNQFCVLHLDDGCARLAQCVDHIQPHNGSMDPLFWDPSNHQPACIHCNSVKGNRTYKGVYTFE